MGSLEENLSHWGRYDWPQRGDEWSEVWGGSQAQWEGAIWPRIRGFLPRRRVLEIASGYGRWSRYLRCSCRELVLVDITEKAIQGCRQLFRSDRGVSAYVNDGLTLPMVAPGSIEFVFSFDSLVHCEKDVLESYLKELSEKLSPSGVGFFHHSNMAQVLADAPGTRNLHWRAESVSAEDFASLCESVGLACSTQEIVDWGGVQASDCFSVFSRPGVRDDGPPAREVNHHFMDEAQSIRIRRSLYPEPCEKRHAAWPRPLIRWPFLSTLMSRLPRSGSGRDR